MTDALGHMEASARAKTPEEVLEFSASSSNLASSTLEESIELFMTMRMTNAVIHSVV